MLVLYLAYSQSARTSVAVPNSTKQPERFSRELTTSELKAVVDASVDIVLVFDADGRYLKVGNGRERMFLPTEEIIGKRVTEVLPRPPATRMLDAIRRALETGEAQRLDYELRIRGADTSFSAIATPTGEGTVVWIARDVTKQRRAEDALRASEFAHRELLAALPLIAYWVSPHPPFAPTYVSPGVQALGYSLAEWMSRADMWLQVIHPDDRERVVAETEAALYSHAILEYEYRVLAKDGSVRWMHDRGELVRDEAGKPIAWRGVMFDVTERRALQDRLAALSEEDDLTKLLNRRGFRRMAEQALKVEHRSGRRTAIIYFDVDNFKSINDRFGHAEGDRALRTIATALRGGLREGDLVARFGGDEFVVLAVGTGESGDSVRLANRLCDHVRRQHAPGESAPPAYSLELSFGVVEDVGESELDDLLHRADTNLYASRARRRAGPGG